MPVELERELKRRARKLFPHDKNRQRRYVYSVLRRTGWTPNGARRKR